LFQDNDLAINPSSKKNEVDVTDVSIGTKVEPKIIKISKALSDDKRRRYVDLMKEIVDVFAWSYEELKTFDTEVINHKITLKEGTKPFQ